MDEDSNSSKNVQEMFSDQLSPEKSSLNQSHELISSLISLSYSIKVFTGKWQSIRNKLEKLLSSLVSVENYDFDDNPSVFIIIGGILETIKHCYDLASRCLEMSYNGKLRMQSDLDIASAELSNHVENVYDLCNLGLLSYSSAMVVSRPGFAASRDDIRFYINDLLSRIKIGSAEMKKQALISFNEVIQEDDRYVKIAVEVDNLITLLVDFLDSEECEIQEECAKAVSVIASFESCKGILISSGVVSPMIRVLEGGNLLSKEFAAKCLQKLTENSENVWSVSAHGGVTPLLNICSNEENGGELIGFACGVLKNLIGVEEIKRFIIDEDAIPLCIKLVSSKDEFTQISSIDFLQTIASGDDTTRKFIIQEDGVRILTRVLDPKSSCTSKAREMALKGIMNLCFPSENSFTILMNYGFLDHILYFLKYGEISVQELSLKASFWLSGISDEAKKAMGDSGFMVELVKFLDSKSYEIREMAAETISSMMVLPRNRKIFAQSDQNVDLIMQLLDPEEGNSGNNKKVLLSMLMLLTSCNSARKKIVKSEHLKNVEKLADSEVLDAKKIVRKLSKNKFHSILSGIWHT